MDILTFFYLNINKYCYIFLVFFLISCSNISYDPARKNNEAFLAKNSVKIRSIKSKHLKIAKEYNIHYSDNNVKKIVDRDFYTKKISNKSKDNLTTDDIIIDEKIPIKDPDFLDDENSLYFQDRKTIDKKISNVKDGPSDIIYLKNNYTNYKKENNIYEGNVITDKQLYGSYEERNKKKYKELDRKLTQKNFDYIYLISEQKKQLFLQELEDEEKRNPKQKSGILDKMKNLLGGNKK